MNLDFIYDSGSSFIVATIILSFFGLLIIGGVAGFLITIKHERLYSRTAMPDLDSPEEEIIEQDDDDMQVLAESVFVVDQEEAHALEDQDSNKLMADINRAKSNEEKVASTRAARAEKFSQFTNIFKKKD